MFSKKCKQHLAENKMTALEHLKFAWHLAWQCKLASGALFIHGLAPRLFQNYASKKINQMHKIINE